MLSGSLSLHSSASHVAICASATSPALVVDKASGLLSLSTNVALSQTPLTCYGIVGTLSLNEGDLLIVVTAREEIGAWRDSVVYKLTDYTLINASLPTPNLSAKQVEDDAVFKMLLADIFTSKFFYFSYTFDLTQSLQRRNGLNFADPLWKRADDRFFWNKNLNINLIERAREDPRFSDFILPITVGFFEFKTGTINGKTFDYGLLSRRSRHRAGTRYNSRGVNDEGHVSNFVETEQLIFDHSSGQESSYVQTRGSIPLYWRQLINAKYTPALNIDHNPKTAESFKLHFTTQLDVYGDQIAVNLINKKGYELRLGKEFEKQIGNLNDPRVKYIHFDFHHECKNMRWDRISVLVDKIEKDLQQQGYTTVDKDGKVLKSQTSVVRTNCMDCLDRTNVVQSVLARRALNLQLADLNILKPNEKVESTSFEPVFKNIWADNADEISRQYSGTGALKTDFTRTGKRSTMGLINDGVNSLTRYVKNNYLDGARQDAFDLFLGVYKVDPSAPSPFVTEAVSVKVYLYPLALIVCLIMALLSVLRFKLVSALVYFVLTYVITQMILQSGQEFVGRPKLSGAALNKRVRRSVAADQPPSIKKDD